MSECEYITKNKTLHNGATIQVPIALVSFDETDGAVESISIYCEFTSDWQPIDISNMAAVDLEKYERWTADWVKTNPAGENEEQLEDVV